jgi:hypothetical protein
VTDAEASDPAATPSLPRWRRWGSTILLVLACIGIVVSSLGLFIRAVLFDTDTWLATVDDLPSDEAIAAELSQYLTDQVFIALDVQNRVSNVLPDKAQPLSAPLTSAVESYVQDEVETFLLSPQFAEIWKTINERAHKGVVLVLRGGGKNVSTKDGEVTLNVIPIINQVLAGLEDKASEFFDFQGDLPEIKEGMVPDEMRTKLEDTLGVKLPEDFGQIVVFKSDALAQVQDAVALFDKLVFYLALLSIVAIAGAIALAGDRRGAVLRLSLGSAAGFWIVLLAIRVVKAQVPGLVDDPGAKAAAEAVVDQTTQLFVNALRTLTVIGLLVALVLWLAGPGRRAVRLRRWASQQIQRTSAGQSVGAWIIAHRDLLRVAGAVLALGLLFILGIKTWLGVLAILALLAAYEFALSLARHPATAADTSEDPASGDGG